MTLYPKQKHPYISQLATIFRHIRKHGIKTKKDRRIEELESLLSYMAAQPEFKAETKDVLTLRHNQILEPGVKQEFALDLISRRFGEELKPFIESNVVISPSGNKVLQASIDILIRKGGSVP